MTSTITVSIKNVYGNRLVYPVCEGAKTFAALAGSKTLSVSNIAHIKDLGYTVNVAPQTL